MSDGFSQYIKDIVRYPLLSKEQEIILSRQVRTWIDPLSMKQREEATPRQIRTGKRAYHKLINCNLRLVVAIAKKYTPHARRTEIFDIVQEGNMGLAHGIKKFDPERGYALSTYVYWWIRQSITRYLSCYDRMIRLPSHAVEMLSKIRALKPKFFHEHGRYPTVEECAAHCNLSVSKVRDYLERSEDSLSLDKVVNNTDGDVTLLDGITDGEHPMDQLDSLLNGDQVLELVMQLNDMDRKIIEEFFALKGGEPKTYQKISKELGISRERTRQRALQAMKRMRLAAMQRSPLTYELTRESTFR